MTSSSAAARDRGGQLKTRSSSGEWQGPPEPGPQDGVCPSSGPAVRVDRQQEAGRCSAGLPGLLQGSTGAPEGDVVSPLRHSAAGRPALPGRAPTPPLGSREPRLLLPRHGPRTVARNPHVLRDLFQPPSGLGRAGPLLLLIPLSQQLLNTDPALSRAGPVLSRLLSSLLGGDPGAPALRVPQPRFCPDAHFEAASTPTFPPGGRPWPFLDPPEEGLGGMNGPTVTQWGPKLPCPWASGSARSAGSQQHREAEHRGRSWLGGGLQGWHRARGSSALPGTREP